MYVLHRCINVMTYNDTITDDMFIRCLQKAVFRLCGISFVSQYLFFFTHLCITKSSLTLYTGLFHVEGMFDKFFLMTRFIEIPAFNANSVDFDQTPRFAASDLGLHFLLIFLLEAARHKWVNA